MTLAQNWFTQNLSCATDYQAMSSFRILVTLLFATLISACRVDVVVTGNGAGEVVSTDQRLKCGNLAQACSAAYVPGKRVTLVATPTANSRFSGWSGACSGESDTCELTTETVKEAFAHFETLLPDDLACGTAGAKAECLTPTRSPEYYVEQSIKYFLTMESSVGITVQPNYSLMVARWEWRPWLLLTGLGNANLVMTDILLKLHPTRYKSIDCRAFPTQPYGRCHVVFDYSGELCPIYEEFTFNDQGEMTFIEAWSDYPTLIPMQDATDTWAEADNVKRLATRVPGLGNATGLIDFRSPAMQQAVGEDADVSDFARRAARPYSEWFRELATHSQAVAEGCKPPRK